MISMPMQKRNDRTDAKLPAPATISPQSPPMISRRAMRGFDMDQRSDGIKRFGGLFRRRCAIAGQQTWGNAWRQVGGDMPMNGVDRDMKDSRRTWVVKKSGDLTGDAPAG